MSTDPGFLLPSATEAQPIPSERDDPGYVPGVQYDQWKRYLLPEPGADPTELVPWTRVTTLAGTIVSQEGLRIWSERNIVRGLGERADLRAMITCDPASKAVQDEVREAAKLVAEEDSASRWGRAVHRALETWAQSGSLPSGLGADDPFSLDLQAAIGLLESEGIKIRLVEQLVVNTVMSYAGRLDALAELPDGRMLIVDWKTGKDVTAPGKRHSIGAQLALYVNAEHTYDPATRTFGRLPAELNKRAGLVLSVREGRAQFFEVNLAEGWERARTAYRLHLDRRASVTFMPFGQPFEVEAPALSALRAELAPAPVAQASPDAVPPGSVIRELVGEPSAPTPEPEIERSPSGRKRRACSKCRQPGHQAKNCPNDGPAPADPQPDAQAVDIPRPTSITGLIDRGETCPMTCGAGWAVPAWSPRPDVTVCGRCGLPSPAILEKLIGERRGASELAQQPAAPILENGTLGAASPPWVAPAPAPSPVQTLAQQLGACRSREELGALWSANQDAWTEELTALAAQLAPGLPVVTPGT